MKKQKTALVDVERRIKICRFEILALDQDIKVKIEHVRSFAGESLILNRLCQSVREKLDECEEKIVDLNELSSVVPKSTDLKDELTVVIKRCRTEVHNNLKNLRLASQAALKNVEFEERSFLLSQTTGGANDIRQRSSKLSQQNADFSNNLTQLLKTMDVQVKQSEESLSTLIGSSQVLGETEFELRSMGATIVSSGKLLSKFGRRELTDRILFIFALMFFFGTVFYIVKKRMFNF